MPTVLDWTPATDPAPVVQQVRDALLAGRAAVLPGDAGYVTLVNPASALPPGLASPPAVLAYGPDDPAGLGLVVPPAARRLMLRVWPGPLTLALPAAAGYSPPGSWGDGVRAAVAAEGLVRFRYPDHPLFDAVVPALEFPALVADTFLPTSAAAAEALGDAVGLVVDGGDLSGRTRPTVVRADASGWAVLEDGAFPRADLDKMAGRLILFVCTGNTCRSPMAEALAKRLLADRLGCGPDDLPARGFWVMSAGVSAYGGDEATPMAASIVAESGADLRDHRSRPVNPEVLAAADDVIAMTGTHAAMLAARYPGYGPPATLLCGADDLPDPIGGDEAVYRECAGIIRDRVERLIPLWVGP